MKNPIRKIISDPVTPALCLFVFFLPLNQLYSLVAIFIIVFLFLVKNDGLSGLKRVIRSRALLFSILFYLLHLVGMSYSSNMDYGWSDMQTKLAFLVFPLLLSAFDITDRRRRLVSLAFAAGAVVSGIMMLWLSLQAYLISGDVQEFFYKKLSHWYHPAYLSIYITVGIVLTIESVFRNRSRLRKLEIAVCIFLFIYLLLLNSRMAIVVCFLAIMSYPLLQLKKQLFTRRSILNYLGSAIVMTALFFGLLHVNNRFAEMKLPAVPTGEAALTEEVAEHSTQARLTIWPLAMKIIQEHALAGVGTGDVRDALDKSFVENGYEFGAEQHLNAHNQFLHTGMSLGLVGITALIGIFLFSLRLSFRRKDWAHFLLLMVVLLNCLTESVLERQAGILFFCFFNTLFILSSLPARSNE